MLVPLALVKTPVLTKTSAGQGLSANSLEGAGGEAGKRSQGPVAEGAESGPCTEAKPELDINCQSRAVRRFTRSQGRRGRGQHEGRKSSAVSP